MFFSFTATLAVLIIGRDLSLMCVSATMRYRMLPPSQAMKHFFNLKIAPVEIRPSYVSKWNTVFQISLLTLSLASPTIGLENSLILTALQ